MARYHMNIILLWVAINLALPPPPALDNEHVDCIIAEVHFNDYTKGMFTGKLWGSPKLDTLGLPIIPRPPFVLMCTMLPDSLPPKKEFPQT